MPMRDPAVTEGPRSPATPPRRLAVVGPTFFSYTQAIASEFERRGVAVETFDEKRSNANLAKIAFRLGLEAHSASPQAKYLRRLADTIIDAGHTDVLLVGVEVINRAMVARLAAAGLRIHLYMWDGHRNKGAFRSYLDLLSSKATFDVADSARFGMVYVPLFADDHFAPAGPDEPFSYDIGFCGTMHSARVREIAALLDDPASRRLELKLMLYYHSQALFVAKAPRQPAVLKLARMITSTPIPKHEVARMFRASRYVLDIAHPGQTGLTARTFETLQSGTRLLTYGSPALAGLPDFLRDRVHVVRDAAEIPRHDMDLPRPPALSDEGRYFLSIQRFVDQLLDGMAR